MRRLRISLSFGVLLLCGNQSFAATQSETNAPAINAAEERKECARNLEIIYKAIRAYQAENLDLPLWLNNLVPKYLSDANVLVCPVCRRTGSIEAPPLSDPKLPSSYLFEFCPVPLGNLYPAEPQRTRREWKRRQMGVLGSTVPLVRCRHHDPALNVSFDGKIFDSPAQWELAFTNVTTLASLTPAKLFGGDRRSLPRFPARSPKATPQQINMTRVYNAGLNENWLGPTNENFSAMMKGLQVVAGTTFDLRGMVQLAGRNLDKKYPSQIKSIPVNLKCKKLHFLHALAGWTPSDSGASAGAYVIRFVGNQARVEIPLVCGRDVACWKASPESAQAASEDETKSVWSKDLGTSKPAKACVFKTTWSNLAPDMEIESIDIQSDPRVGGLLVLGISAE